MGDPTKTESGGQKGEPYHSSIIGRIIYYKAQQKNDETEANLRFQGQQEKTCIVSPTRKGASLQLGQ